MSNEYTYHWQIIQHDELQAEGWSHDHAHAWRELEHYGMIYGQDGPVRYFMEECEVLIDREKL